MQSYQAIHHTSPIKNRLMELVDAAPQEMWVPYYNFDAIPVPGFILDEDPMFAFLAARYKFHAGVLRMPPNTCYNWHVDTDRKVGINMLVSGDNSECLFLDGEPGVAFKFTKLQYAPDTYYVFNTQIPHMVLNHANTRYLFSVEFLEESKGLTFSELIEVFKDINHGDKH